MKKRGRAATKKPTTAANLLVSPPQGATNTSNQSTETPKSFQFMLDSPVTTTGRGNRRKPIPSPVKSSPFRRTEAMSTISELKELASSRLDTIKRQVERSHSDILKEIESSHSRLYKRFKMQSQACQQLTDETDKEFKKMSERITESCEAMKVSYSEFIAEAQTTVSRVCKTSIPEKAQSFEKALDAFRSRYGILSTPA